MTQIEFINQIVQLHQSNPEYEIHFFVRGDETTEHHYTAQRITKIEIGRWYPDGGETIMTDEDEIREQLEYEISEDKSLSDSEIDRIVENKLASVPMAIIAYTHAI